jgi:hypothetical protein
MHAGSASSPVACSDTEVSSSNRSTDDWKATPVSSSPPSQDQNQVAAMDNPVPVTEKQALDAPANAIDASSATPSQEEAVEYPKLPQLILIALALAISIFLIALDSSIIATAIPRITDEFNSLPDVAWYGSCEFL